MPLKNIFIEIINDWLGETYEDKQNLSRAYFGAFLLFISTWYIGVVQGHVIL